MTCQQSKSHQRYLLRRRQEHLIIYKFDSPTEFDNFKLQYQDRLSFKELTNSTVAILSVCPQVFCSSKHTFNPKEKSSTCTSRLAVSNQTKVVGIKLTVYDEDNKVIDTISSVTANEDTKNSIRKDIGFSTSSTLNKPYLNNISFVCIKRKFCVFVNETDTSYFVECKKINETANLDVQVDDFSLGLNVCFEEHSTK